MKNSSVKEQTKFYELFRAYLKRCKNSIERYPDAKPMFNKHLEQCRVNSSGRFSFWRPLMVDYEQTAYVAFSENKSTFEYIDFALYLTEHKIIGRRTSKNTFADFGVPSTSTARLVCDLLAEYLRKNKSFNYNKRILLNLYQSILDFYSQNTFRAIITCYLENVGIRSKQFRVSDHILLKSLSSRNVETLYNSNKCFRKYYSGLWTKGNSLKYVTGILQVCFSSKIAYKGDSPPTNHYNSRYRGEVLISNLLTSLRLNSLGDVAASPVTVTLLELPFKNIETPQGDNMFRRPINPGVIEPHLYRRIRKTFQDVSIFRKSQLDPDLLFNRLQITSHRDSDEDVVVDSCIAMETLVKSFLVKEDRGRMAVRDMAVHVAHLLRSNHARRKQVYEIVREGFKIRDMIVHGRRMKLKTHDPLWKFYSVLREAIRTVIAQGSNIKKRNIEDLVL